MGGGVGDDLTLAPLHQVERGGLALSRDCAFLWSPRCGGGTWIAACAAMTGQGQRRLVFVEGVVVEEGLEGGLGFGG